MEQYVGLDVSQEQTSVCVIDGGGQVIWEGKCTSSPEAIAATIGRRAPEAVRIGLESGPLSAWHWHELRKLSLPVVCLDARHAKAALALQLNKSDRNDARGLAQIVRTGWYREVVVKSVDSHLVRSLLTTRAQLVRMRVDLANQIRGVLKPFGLIAGKGGGGPSPSGGGRWSRAGRCRRWLGRCWRPGRPSASRSRCSAVGSWPWPGRTRRRGG
jgi:transposase